MSDTITVIQYDVNREYSWDVYFNDDRIISTTDSSAAYDLAKWLGEKYPDATEVHKSRSDADGSHTEIGR